MAKQPKLRLVPRLGPKVNIRPGGPHKPKRFKSRRDIKIALRKQGDLPFSGPARKATIEVIIKI